MNKNNEEAIVDLKRQAVAANAAGDTKGAKDLLAKARELEFDHMKVDDLDDPQKLKLFAIHKKKQGDLQTARQAMKKATQIETSNFPTATNINRSRKQEQQSAASTISSNSLKREENTRQQAPAHSTAQKDASAKRKAKTARITPTSSSTPGAYAAASPAIEQQREPTSIVPARTPTATTTATTTTARTKGGGDASASTRKKKSKGAGGRSKPSQPGAYPAASEDKTSTAHQPLQDLSTSRREPGNVVLTTATTANDSATAAIKDHHRTRTEDPILVVGVHSRSTTIPTNDESKLHNKKKRAKAGLSSPSRQRKAASTTSNSKVPGAHHAATSTNDPAVRHGKRGRSHVPIEAIATVTNPAEEAPNNSSSSSYVVVQGSDRHYQKPGAQSISIATASSTTAALETKKNRRKKSPKNNHKRKKKSENHSSSSSSATSNNDKLMTTTRDNINPIVAHDDGDIDIAIDVEAPEPEIAIEPEIEVWNEREEEPAIHVSAATHRHNHPPAIGTQPPQPQSSQQQQQQHGHQAQEENLIVAELVQQSSEAKILVSAVEVDPNADDDNNKPIYQHKQFPKIAAVVACLVLIIIISVAVRVSSGSSSDGGNNDDAPNDAGPITTSTTTMAPTGVSPNYAVVEEKVKPWLQHPSEVQNQNSPYYKALHWIVYEDDINPNASNLQQRYLLAAFYFSTSRKSPWSYCAHEQPNNSNGGDASSQVCDYVHKQKGGMEESIRASRWLSPNNECDWAGVNCHGNDGSIKGIRLNGFRMNGDIPDQMGLLTRIKDFDLSFNRGIKGTIPSTLGGLSEMHKLKLAECQLQGSLPEEICNAQELEDLDVSRNQLVGTIPACLGNLINLEELILDKNDITGTIPSELGKLLNLNEADLDTNALRGSVPSELCAIQSLTKLKVDCASQGRQGVVCNEPCDCICN